RFLLRARARLRMSWLTVLTYHRVVDLESAIILDPDVVDADLVEFELALDLLQRYFNLVSIVDVIASRSGHDLPPNPALLTFDDGYRDNYDVVLPILLRRGISATFFIATAYPDAETLYWWDKLALIIRRATKEPVVLEASGRFRIFPRGDLEGARKTIF